MPVLRSCRFFLLWLALPAAAQTTLSAFPLDRQLVARVPGASSAAVTVAGQSDVAVEVRVFRGGLPVATEPQPAGAFALTLQIPADTVATRVEVWAGGVLVRAAADVVAGDVFVVNGQSNARANAYHGEDADIYASPWIRSFGRNLPVEEDPAGAAIRADSAWHVATGNQHRRSGFVGQWPLRMAQVLVGQTGVPVAVLNGAQDGQGITFFLRGAPGFGTNYGRLLWRLRAAGVAAGHVRAVLWYQGESDAPDVLWPLYAERFGALKAAWDADLAPARTYVVQVRPCVSGSPRLHEIREVQRQLGRTYPDVSVLTANGLDGHDGCHFYLAGGYEPLGRHAAALVAAQLYGLGTYAGPPEMVSALLAAGGLSVAVGLDVPDAVSVPPGAAADFRLAGTSARVLAVHASDGGVVLTLDGEDVSGVTTLSYVANHPGLGPHPWIVDASGAGMLAGRVPVSRPVAEPSGPARPVLSVLSVFPSPTRAAASVRGPRPGVRVDVVDALGRRVWGAVMAGSEMWIPAGVLAPGVYRVRSGASSAPLVVTR